MGKETTLGKEVTAGLWVLTAIVFLLASEGDSLAVAIIAVVNLVASWLYALRALLKVFNFKSKHNEAR